MRKFKILLVFAFSFMLLVGCAKVETEVTNLIKSIDGSYSTTVSGVAIDIKVEGEEVTGKAGVGFLAKDISGTVDLKKQKINIDVAGNLSISGEYEVVSGGDLEVDVSGQTIIFDRN